MTEPDLTFLDAFCGAGGLSLGLEQAGFRLLGAFDIDVAAVRTFNRRFGENSAVVEDIRLLTSKNLRQALKINQYAELDLLAGGPPCQGFSKQKRDAHLGDPRNDLVLEFARLARDLEPRFVLLENVAMLGQKRGRDFVARLHRELRSYDLFPHFYNCADFGLAQTRQRFIIVGRRNDVRGAFTIPAPLAISWSTVKDVIGDLPEPPEDFSDHPAIPNHQRARVTAVNIHRFSFVPQGGGWRDIPTEWRLSCHLNVDVTRGGWPDVYGRLSWDGQCPTITGGFDSFTRGRYGHPCKNRPLTPREAARLQGFPDDFVFLGTRADIRAQIGNAVPPPLAAAVGASIRRSLLIATGLRESTESDRWDTQFGEYRATEEPAVGTSP